MRNRKLSKCFFAVLLVVILATTNGLAATQPTAPTLMDVNTSGAEGDWYAGAIPSNYIATKPVLVFVQGKGDTASSWWDEIDYYGVNDMYKLAYNAGYRTAFVNFGDAEGKERTMWVNGATFSKQLQMICAYYGVSKVSLICHSKGGIDAQTAIVYDACADMVDRLFMLSTPNWGSQLADLAYSSSAGSLANVLGLKSDATYVLQTGYMAYFRSITDTKNENKAIKYYTFAGTNWGPSLSSLHFCGLYLNSYGANDGAVTVTSAHNPLATHISTSDLNHYNIRFGSNVWPKIAAKLSSKSTSSTTAKSVADSATTKSSGSTTESNSGNYWLSGNDLVKNKTTVINIPVESAATAVTFDLLLANSSAKIQLKAPSGAQVSSQTQFEDQSFFKGAAHFVFPITQPEAGYWKLSITSSQKNAYFLIANYESTLQTNLSTNSLKSENHMQFALNWNDQNTAQIANANVSAQLCQDTKQHQSTKIADMTFTTNDTGFVNTTPMPTDAGMYNVNVSIKGVLDDGTPFARSQVRSIVITPANETNTDSLKQLVE